MSHIFSHLIWLGANIATEPAALISRAKQATLFEAREAACHTLREKFSDSKVNVIQSVLATENGEVEFTEYNLGEFSAIHSATGVLQLFPGLKAINSKTTPAIAITDAIQKLSLDDNNNLLVVDILDNSLNLLTALKDQLFRFSEVYVLASHLPLYSTAITSKDVMVFMQNHGFILQDTRDTDLDIPWLVFSIHPLWDDLQKKQQEFDAYKLQIAKEIEKLNLRFTQEQEKTRKTEEQLNAQLVKTKLLAKAETDLKDLRKKYSELSRRHEALVELAKTQHEKLNKALDFYQQLQTDYPNFLEDK